MLESVDSEHWKHHQRLLILEFIPLDDDACVYTKGQSKEMNSLIVHVDNSIIAAPSDAEVFLGCPRSRNYDAGTIAMRQTAYVLETL
ncbi:uncharacterized protein N7446_003134 [Penicillium canescens]|uniref:uncharacterized protein n=1 Tax=Penicillium canescens TaxID=5083 RepID=UPI0026DF76FC|nr:uncharacterized protein N7446_003134 [Penicillium canescens]KAJ6075357.1 hypothetical protein N7446_003134 [Penicillium canescens]